MYKRDLDLERNWHSLLGEIERMLGQKPKDLNGVLFLTGGLQFVELKSYLLIFKLRDGKLRAGYFRFQQDGKSGKGGGREDRFFQKEVLPQHLSPRHNSYAFAAARLFSFCNTHRI